MAQDIRTRLILDNSQFRRGMEQSQRQTRSFSQSLGGAVRVARTFALAIGGAVGGLQALSRSVSNSAAAIRDLSRSIGISSKFIQEFRFAAQQSSVDIGSADRALEQFSRRLGEAARGTGEARRTLLEMGINVRDTNGRLRDADAVLKDVADSFRNTRNATVVADRANQLFGRSGIELIGVLRGGSRELDRFAGEARRLGAVLSEQDVEQLGRLSDSYTNVGAAVRGIVNEFVLGLSPALLELNENMEAVIAANHELARSLGDQTGEALLKFANAIKVLADNMDIIRNSILVFVGTGVLVKLARNLAALSKFFTALTAALLKGVEPALKVAKGGLMGLLTPFVLLTGKILAVVAAVALLTKWYRDNKDDALELGETTTSLGEIVRAVWFGITQAVGTAVQSISDWFSSLRERLLEPWQRLSDIVGRAMNAVLQVIRTAVNAILGIWVGMGRSLIDIIMVLPSTFMSVMTSIIGIVREGGTTIANIFAAALRLDFDAIKDEYAGFTAEAGRLLSEGIAAPLGNIGKIISDNLSDSLQIDFVGKGFEIMGRAVGFTSSQLEKLVLAYRRFNTVAQETTQRTKEISPPGSDPKDAEKARSYWEQFSLGWRNAFEEWKKQVKNVTEFGEEMFKKFTDGMTDSLTDFFMTGKLNMKSFLQDIVRMIIRSQIQNALLSAFSGFGSLFGGGGGGSAFGQGIHTLLGSAFAGGKALGGMIPAGQVGLVGERGPEFISGPAQITPIRQSDTQQQPTQITYNINAVDSKSFKDMLAQDPEFLFGVSQRGARGFAI
jgi:hypothetical protein